MQNSTSKGQLYLYDILKEKYPDAILNFSGILPFKYIDIFIPSLDLCIEYDGMFWHEDKIEKDVARSEAILNAGARVINFRIYEETYDTFFYIYFIEEFVKSTKRFAWVEIGSC